jgi:cob(I)alamin adenosyltransferase
MKKSHLYTRGGDLGTTSLIGGSRVKKCSLQLEAYGTIDELSSHIGLLIAMIKAGPKLETHWLQWIQSRLFDVGTHLAMPCTEDKAPHCAITMEHVTLLEQYIDMIDAQLVPLRSFILPGGSVIAAQCHVCRAVCRRGERLITALAEKTKVNPDLQSYVNRLSDFLFAYARFINKMEGIDEISWRNDCD